MTDRASILDGGSHAPTGALQLLLDSLVPIVAALIRADQVIKPEERQAVLRQFRHLGFNTETRQYIDAQLERELCSDPRDLFALCQDFYAGSTTEERLILLQLLYSIATCDLELEETEMTLIHNVVEWLQIKPEDHDAIRSAFVRATPEAQEEAGIPDLITTSLDLDRKYRSILGLPGDFTEAELETACQRQLARHDPEKLAHLGADMRQVAEHYTRKIRDAYRYLRAPRGPKPDDAP